MIVQLTHLGFRLEARLQHGVAKVLTPMPVPFTQPLEESLESLGEQLLKDYYPSDDDRCAAWASLLEVKVLDPELLGPPPSDPNVMH